jgi:hypothetical protein
LWTGREAFDLDIEPDFWDSEAVSTFHTGINYNDHERDTVWFTSRQILVDTFDETDVYPTMTNEVRVVHIIREFLGQFIDDECGARFM